MEEEQNVQDEHVEEEVEDEEEVEEEDPEEEPEGDSKGDDPYAGLSESDLKKRLAKAEKAIVKNKGKQPKEPKAPITKQPKGDEIPEWGQKIIQSEEKRSFGYEHQLSPEQVDAVFRYNGGKAPDEKFLERPEVKAMVKAIGSKDRVALNTPKGGTGVVYKGKTFSEVASDEKSSTADKQAAFEGVRKKHGVG
jgi:hypothetical protein